MQALTVDRLPSRSVLQFLSPCPVGEPSLDQNRVSDSSCGVQDMAQQQRVQSASNMDDNLAHNIAAKSRYKCALLCNVLCGGDSVEISSPTLGPLNQPGQASTVFVCF